MPISDWPENERPREKLLAKGAAALSNAELLAIFLRVGIRGKSAVDLARDLVTHFGSLNHLFAASATELSTIPGIGEAKYTQLQAVIELARRALRESMAQTPVLANQDSLKDYLRLTLRGLPHESFHALWLDNQNRLLVSEQLARGSLRHAAVYPREIVRAALAHNAASIVFAHNHPAGTAEPSEQDLEVTRTLKAALRLVDVNLLDHFVVAGDSIVSMAARGLI